MKHYISAVLILMLLVGMFSCAFAAEEETILTVQGSGVVYMDADQATITLGVRETFSDVMAAQSEVNKKINAVIEVLKGMGIPKNNIYTSSISIYPNYDYSDAENKIIGYTAFNSISALTGDLEKVGEYIDAAFAAGANTLDNVAFSASDTKAASDQALTLAVQNAMDKANVLATAANMKVEYIQEISESMNYGSVNTAYRNAEKMESAASGSTQVMASQLQISASVTIKAVIH